jgi:hypothetical protein
MPNPAVKTGTHDIDSLLATRFTSVIEFGMDTIEEVLRRDLEVHNMLARDIMGDLVVTSEDRRRLAGSSTRLDMFEVDEYGRGPTQKELPGSTVDFPLKKYQLPVGWNQDWFYEHTPADMATAILGVEQAHMIQLRREVQRAIFLSANYSTVDRFTDNVTLAVKRLVNADSAPIPDGPNGEVFNPATHTHYNAEATLSNAGLLASINDLVEHGHGGNVKLVIAIADEATVRALTDFTAYLDPRVSVNANANEAIGARLDITRIDNRAIGIFGAAEVWIKPWAIADYALIYDTNSPAPIVMREKPTAQLKGLRLAAKLETHPLIAEYFEAYFGMGIWTRTNGVVHYFGGATYADPTIS